MASARKKFLTMRPPELTAAEHRRAEEQGWSIFNVLDGSQVQKIDELDLLESDEEACILARKMGLVVDADGYVGRRRA